MSNNPHSTDKQHLNCTVQQVTDTASTKLTSVVLELCVGGIDDVMLAAELGVDRIELNCGMTTGGLTPSAGLVASARRIFTGPVVSMVRPREGGFAYSRDEFLLMLNDAERMADMGITELAIGFLRTDGTVDVERCRKLRAILPKCHLVFHKAFDVTPDRTVAIRQLMDCGFDRILTSGGATTALAGVSELRRLNELIQSAGSRLSLVAGGGIRGENVRDVLAGSHCLQVHSAVRDVADDRSMPADCALHFGVPGESPGSFGQASRSKLEHLLSALGRHKH